MLAVLPALWGNIYAEASATVMQATNLALPSPAPLPTKTLNISLRRQTNVSSPFHRFHHQFLFLRDGLATNLH